MPLPTTYLFASAPLLTGEARVQRFVDKALGPTTRRHRPEIADRLAAAKLAHPQSEPAWPAQTAAGMLFNPLGRQRRITQPALVVQGTADQVVDPKRLLRMVTDFLTDSATPVRESAPTVRRAS